MVFGATGVIGRRLLSLLIADGNEIIGVTRRSARTTELRALGAEAVVADALEAVAIQRLVAAVAPDAIIHQLTDLTSHDFAANARLRTVATRHIVDAAKTSGVRRVVAQSIAWTYPPGVDEADEESTVDRSYPGVFDLEDAVLELESGVVLRYGLLYGPGTWYSRDGANAQAAHDGTLTAIASPISFTHVDDAAAAARAALSWPRGVFNIVDDEPAPAEEWLPLFARVVGAPEPPVSEPVPTGRPVSNNRATSLGWRPLHPSWRAGFTEL